MNIYKLVNANCYLAGTNLVGQVDEVMINDINVIKLDHKPVSAHGKIKVAVGIDNIDGSIKWNAFYADAFAKLANIYKNYALQIRGNLMIFDASGKQGEQAVVISVTISPSTVFPSANFVQHENVELKTNFDCVYYKLESNGRIITEIDQINNVYTVDGVDVLSAYRSNLGV